MGITQANIAEWVEKKLAETWSVVQARAFLIVCLTAVGVAAYGFALFNYHFTIDEEIHSVFSGAALSWVAIGRWGMYVLNKLLLPYTVIPFVPLFLALFFHIAGILLLVECWQVESKVEQVAVGAVCLAYPGLAYMYTFSIINYGIGFGLFCCGLSGWLFSRPGRWSRLGAVLPAVFAIAIYQGFILALGAVYAVYLLASLRRTARSFYRQVLEGSGVLFVALLLYWGVHRAVLAVSGVPESNYIPDLFRFESLQDNLAYLLGKFWDMLLPLYLGGKSVYTLQLYALEALFIGCLLGMAWGLWRYKAALYVKLLIGLGGASLVALPFLSGFVMNGHYQMRFLVALPVVLAGLLVLGLRGSPKLFRLVLLLAAGYCVLQFVVSINHLFASSSLALEADRLVGVRLVERMDAARWEAGRPAKYLEVAGFLQRPATELMPKFETFGASFFEWDQGSAQRIVLFLQSIGVHGYEALAVERRADMIAALQAMPAWPDPGSVRVVEDVVLIKFGPYSSMQKQSICEQTAVAGFCP